MKEGNSVVPFFCASFIAIAPPSCSALYAAMLYAQTLAMLKMGAKKLT